MLRKINKNYFFYILITIIVVILFYIFFGKTFFAFSEEYEVFINLQKAFYLNSSIPFDKQLSGIDIYKCLLLIITSATNFPPYSAELQLIDAIFPSPEMFTKYFLLSDVNCLNVAPYSRAIFIQHPIILQNFDLFFLEKQINLYCINLEFYENLIDNHIKEIIKEIIEDQNPKPKMTDAMQLQFIQDHINKLVEKIKNVKVKK
jgi:hypothetical protein